MLEQPEQTASRAPAAADEALPGWRPTLARARTDLPLALLLILFFALPLFRSAALEDSFITPKVALAAALAVVAALAWLLGARGNGNGAPGARLTPVGTAVLLLWAVHVSSLAWAGSAALALQASAYWTVFALLHLVCAAVARGGGDVWMLLRAGIAAAVATAAWTLFEDATRGMGLTGIVARLPDWRGHLSAGLGNSGHIAGFIGVFLPAALVLFLRAPRFPAAMFLGIVVMFAALIVTWSVGSTGAALLSLLVWGVVAAVVLRRPDASPLHWRRLAAAVAAGLALMAFYFLPHPLNPHHPSLWTEAFSSQRWEEGWPTRVAIWQTTLQMIDGHPVGGVGAGNFTLYYVQQIVPSLLADPALRPYAGLFTNDAHNEYLHVQAETGIAGTLALAALVLLFFRAVVRGLRRAGASPADRLALIAAGAGATTVLLDALMTFPFRLPAHLAALMLCLAVPAAVAPVAGAGRWHRPPLRVVLWLMLLAGLLAAGWQARRVAAEYAFKQGRRIADSVIVLTPDGPAPAWAAAEAMTRGAMMALAAGDRVAVDRMMDAARAHATTRGMDDVERLFARTLAIDPRYSNASSRHGALLLMRGLYAQAAEQLAVTLLDLQSPEIHERMGMALMLNGRPTEASAHWRVLIDRQPAKRDLYEALLRRCAQ